MFNDERQTVFFAGSTCNVEYEKYCSGGIRIQLHDAEDGCPVATATVHLEGIPRDYVAIKDYSENMGMLQVLINARIVSEPVTYRQSGQVTIPICKLLKIERTV